jgi:hypothetical protein
MPKPDYKQHFGSTVLDGRNTENRKNQPFLREALWSLYQNPLMIEQVIHHKPP